MGQKLTHKFWVKTVDCVVISNRLPNSLNNRTLQSKQKDEILNTKNENVELVSTARSREKVDQLLKLDVEENLKTG